MLFHSLSFLYFFISTWLIYLCLTRRYRNIFLLIASYVFYGFCNIQFVWLLAFKTVVNYICARKIDSNAVAGRRTLWLVASIAINILILAYFKYFNFFAEALNELLQGAGKHPPFTLAEIAFPLGVSFFTFQGMAYVIDVYRRRIPATRDFVDFGLFSGFFPQLIAGPIERADHMMPQIQSDRKLTAKAFEKGIWLIILGLYKKLVLADNLAPFVSQVFANPRSTTGPMVILGVYGAAFQLYGDFSGYSDIARGLARLLGFDLSLNFNAPFFADNIRDFWQRWHITLSSWFRDYLFRPLAQLGRPLGRPGLVLALFCTFTAAGLWHGPAGHFLAWGFCSAIPISVYHLFKKPGVTASTDKNFFQKSRDYILTFHSWCLVGILFVVHRISDLPILWSRLSFIPETKIPTELITLVVFGTPVVLYDYLSKRHDNPDFILQRPYLQKWFVFAVFLFLIWTCGSTGVQEYYYFQF